MRPIIPPRGYFSLQLFMLREQASTALRFAPRGPSGVPDSLKVIDTRSIRAISRRVLDVLAKARGVCGRALSASHSLSKGCEPGRQRSEDVAALFFFSNPTSREATAFILIAPSVCSGSCVCKLSEPRSGGIDGGFDCTTLSPAAAGLGF